MYYRGSTRVLYLIIYYRGSRGVSYLVEKESKHREDAENGDHFSLSQPTLSLSLLYTQFRLHRLNNFYICIARTLHVLYRPYKCFTQALQVLCTLIIEALHVVYTLSRKKESIERMRITQTLHLYHTGSITHTLRPYHLYTIQALPHTLYIYL